MTTKRKPSSLEKEMLEAARVELARKDELIDDLRAMHGVPSDADLARARDDEAQLLTGAMHALRAYQFGNADPTLAQQTADAIERRISGRAK